MSTSSRRVFPPSSAGGDDIVCGKEYPKLRDWENTTDLGSLPVTGISK